MKKIIQSAKGIFRSKTAWFFVLIFVLLVVVPLILRSRPEPIGEYRFVEMGPGGSCLFLSLNDNGRAAGYVRRQGKECAAVWDKSTGVTFLNTPAGFSSLARDINNSGQVCGELRDPNDKFRACFWDSDGQMYDIGTLGGRASIAEAINEKGRVVGWSETSARTVHAFLWTKEQGITDLDTRGELFSYGLGMNDRGQIVGNLITTGGQRHVYLWQEETGMVDIHDRLRGIRSHAMGITNSGMIYGEYFTTNNLIHGFVWDKVRGFRDLKISSEKEYFNPFVITDSGYGVFVTRQERLKKFGFVFKKEKKLSLLLNKKLKKQYLYEALQYETNYFVAYDINNSGQIIAIARESGTYKWYLMTPIESGD